MQYKDLLFKYKKNINIESDINFINKPNNNIVLQSGVKALFPVMFIKANKTPNKTYQCSSGPKPD